MIVLAAFVVAGFSATFSFQYQALFYLLCVIFKPVTTIEDFQYVTFWYMGIILFSALYRAVGGGK